MSQETDTLEFYTTEQEHRTDPEYIAAVNAGIEEGLKQLREGKGIPHEEVWAALGVDVDE